MILKWGCDGSQHSQFIQKFQNSTDSDANIFQSSLVPLRLIVTIKGEVKIIWQNPVPSSVRFCRPVHIRFVSESNDITKEEIKYIEDRVKTLTKTEILAPDGIVKIKHTMLFTMIDGKVCNAATDTLSTMRCYICGQTSRVFNELNEVQKVNVEALQFGLSVLYARIRFFEARNINFRQYRQNYSRKFPREDCNRDIMNRLLLSSDPYLSSIRPRPQSKKKAFSKEALNLMLPILPPPLSLPSYDEISDTNTEKMKTKMSNFYELIISKQCFWSCYCILLFVNTIIYYKLLFLFKRSL